MYTKPALCSDPLKGESPDFIQTLLGHWIISMPAQKIANLCLNDYSVAPYLKKIDIPVLLIRGKYDPMVNNEDFYTMWTMLRTSQKAAFIKPYHHSNSFQREGRNRYLHVENCFIQ